MGGKDPKIHEIEWTVRDREKREALLDRKHVTCVRSALATGRWVHLERCGAGTGWFVIDPTRVS